MILYEAFLNNDESNRDYAFEEAAKAAGKLLKAVLHEDRRTFESKKEDTKKEYIRSYRWNGEMDNRRGVLPTS